MSKHKYSIYILIICTLLYSVQIILNNGKETEKIAILGFHNVVQDDEKERYYKTNMWVEGISSFQEKMEYLYEAGYQTITLDQLYEWKKGNLEISEKSFVLTFDDGYYASSTLIPAILEKYGFTASTFVVGSSVEDAHQWDASSLQYVSRKDMQDQTIMKYYSHTYDLHGKIDGEFALDAVPKEELQHDIDKQKEVVNTSFMAYPYGHYNDTVIDVLKENDCKLAFGYNENRKAERNGNFYKIPRFAVTAYTNMEVFQAMLESK